ncbi:MAG TPA: hypothetical protein VLF66_09415 [Thermoanaerobaculia bacterium]|nr:hypothetical protein [Thermoanaerobaculia bacterium]
MSPIQSRFGRFHTSKVLLCLGLAWGLLAARNAVAQDVNVAVGDLESGGAVTVEFLVTVDQPVAPGTTAVCNQGTVSGDNFDPDVLTDDPSEPGAADATCTPVEVLIDLVVSKSESIDPVVAGSGAGNLTYVVTVLNDSLDTATGVTLSETLTTPCRRASPWTR